MKIFDPAKSHEVALKFSLAYELRTVYDSKRPMGNVAASELGAAIKFWLISLDKEAAPILPRSLEWIDDALQNGEVNRLGSDPNWHSTTLYWAKALGTWMYAGEPGSIHWAGADDPQSWDRARIFEEARWRFPGRPWPTNEVITYGLDDYLAFTIGAGPMGQYEYGPHNEIYAAGIDMYERWTGKSGIELSGRMKPREFGYALCLRNAARQSFTDDELFSAGRKMLQANLQSIWLGGGQYIRAATWLKIVYSLSGEDLTPLQTILKAYDNMPKVERPDFVSAG